ncbi:MlaA family lipoprotein [Ramlibacter albus]|uniref:VacJ family lipoprotein n=1 Tax=Ramlibacter albus TaxID=2079448 RepID=A0A923S0A9_9BURK|nr:VacJ family lipoprotein [Ramlibacter albus]MBC5763070.1 VacJ family lipoprotein [Ramlibacter albus]
MRAQRSLPRSVWVGLAAVCAVCTGCATGPNADPRDPLEPLNRRVHHFNVGLDRAVIKPVAIAYSRDVPSPIRRGVSNFFGNLGDAWSAVNSLAQLKLGDAAQNATRFAFNTVLGLGGLLDIAGEVGIERHKETFGSTLAHWGVPAGPYLVLPLLGPSTLRDAAALPVERQGDVIARIHPVPQRNALEAARLLDTRATLLPLDAMLRDAFDPYTFTRDVYLQHRAAQSKDGDDDGRLSRP